MYLATAPFSVAIVSAVAEDVGCGNGSFPRPRAHLTEVLVRGECG